MPRFEPELKAKMESDSKGIVEIGPLEEGLGHTLGNSLRRTVLSYLPGAAVTEVRAEGVAHEFTAIEGIKEDMIEVLLNIKRINFKMEVKKPQIVTLEAEGVGEVTAGDLRCPTGVEVLNTDLVLANLTKEDAVLELRLKVEFGRGYRAVDKQKSKVGVILMDADFSPVRKVAYHVEPARVGRVSDLDKVVFDIETDGSISPEAALLQAAAVLEQHYGLIKQNVEVEQVWGEDEQQLPKEKEEKPKKRRVYLEELNLPTRVLNALRKSGVETVEDLKELEEEELSSIKNIGPKSIEMIEESLEGLEDA